MRKGEKAIRILAPVAVKQRDEAGEETGERKVFFRTVPAFDVSMTDPLPGKEPVPLEPPWQPITGHSHRGLIAPLRALAGELGYRVEIRELPDDGPGGWCDAKRREIVIAAGPANRQVRTLVPWRKRRIPTFGMPSSGRCGGERRRSRGGGCGVAHEPGCDCDGARSRSW